MDRSIGALQPATAMQQTPAPLPMAEPQPAPASLCDDSPFPRQGRWLLTLFALYFISRTVLLLLSRRYLMSDEAVVGVMALNIRDGKPIPFFLYGQMYGGGHVIEALLMVPWLKLFGPSDLIVKGVCIMLGGLHLAMVYAVLHRYFSKRLALIAAALYAFCGAMVGSNFQVSGGMATMFFAWVGLFFFFSHYYGERPRPAMLFLSGVSLGLAYYCYDYALLYILGISGLLLFKHRLGLWRQWRALAALVCGLSIGALPLIVFNFKNNFVNFKALLNAGSSDHPLTAHLPLWRRFLGHWAALLAHDFPGSFSTDVNVFPDSISLLSWIPWGIFCLSLGAMLVMMLRPILARLRGLAPGAEPSLTGREARPLCFLYFFALYGCLYCAYTYAGQTPRYVLPFYPFLPILFAWTMMRPSRTRPRWAALGAALFLAPQLWMMAALACDATTNEWEIKLRGEDIKKVARFLEDRRLTTVMAPYEIKWKLMFYSDRKIDCTAAMFGFDREDAINARALNRINHGEAPLTVVLDKALRLPRIALKFNPARAFDIKGFHSFLERNDVCWRETLIGDYVVFHEFTEKFVIYNGFQFWKLKPVY